MGSTSKKAFTGTIYGNGHKISYTANAGSDAAALILYAKNVTISGLQVDAKITATSHEKIMVLRRNGHCQEYGGVLAIVEELFQAARAHDGVWVKAALKRLVPEYIPSDTPSVLCAPAALASAE